MFLYIHVDFALTSLGCEECTVIFPTRDITLSLRDVNESHEKYLAVISSQLQRATFVKTAYKHTTLLLRPKIYLIIGRIHLGS